jgi:hypothetical protein
MNITTAYRQMAQESYDASMAAEQTQLDEAAIKSQIIKDGYIYFPDDDELYKVSPYKLIGKASKLGALGVQKWYSVNVATGEDLDDAGLAEIDADEKGRWFTVTKNIKDTDAALISSEPNNIYL